MRRLVVPLVLASSLALGAGLLVGPAAVADPLPRAAQAVQAVQAVQGSGGAESVPPSTLAPRIDYVGLATLAFGVAKKLYACEDLANQGLECLKEPTIKDVLNRLNEIEAQMARNQAQTMRAIDSLQRSIDGEALAKAVKDLSPVEAHIFEAAKAWEALSDCADEAVKSGATCRGYNGARTQALPVAEGMALSREFFLDQMGKISLTIEQATQFFAGTRSISGRDGLLHALWRSAKRQQDRDSGAVSPAELPLQPVVVTPSLAATFLPTMTYYRDMMFLYGALRPAAKELKQQTSRAQSEANLAEGNIFSTSTRWTVAGAFGYYRIPDVPKGALAYVGKDGKLYKLTQGEGKGARLTAGVLQDLGKRIADYGYNADVMGNDPMLLPNGGRFSVIEKVKKRDNAYYSGKYAICASNASTRGCDPNLDGVRRQTFEIGHDQALGSTDSYGNVMKERWATMRILSDKADWASLEESYENASAGKCDLRGNPPYGVWNVRFRSTFDRLVAGKYATYDWMTVYYGYSTRYGVTPDCVGPGVYLPETHGDPYSLVDRGTPAGILVK